MNDKFVQFNANPKEKKTTDCVIRALTVALNKPIKDVISGLTDIYLKKGYFITDKKCIEQYLKNEGYIKQKQVRYPEDAGKLANKKFTGKEFCVYLNNITTDISETIIATIGTGHITIFVNKGTKDNKDYKIVDSWDCSNKCVGNWWTR